MRSSWKLDSVIGISTTSSTYSRLDHDEKNELLNNETSTKERPEADLRRNHIRLLVTVLNAIFFVVSSTLFGAWYYNTHIILNADLRRSSSYSPIFDLVKLDTRLERLNGTLFQPKEPSIARMMPNPESDRIWEEWELTRALPVTAEQIRRMGKDPDTAVKFEDETWGLGDDAYVAIFDVYHQLHCLNTLRQIAYKDYYNATREHLLRPELYEVHINHCVDMLMQTIQCSGNVNLITMHWVDTQTYPYPDMSINKKCMNFDKLTEWRRGNTVDMEKYKEVMKKPEGAKQLPNPELTPWWN